MESKWPTRQPLRLDRGGVVPVDRERGIAFLRSLGCEDPADQGNGVVLSSDEHEPATENALLQTLEAELATGVLMMRIDYLQVSLPWRVDSTTLPVVEALLLKWHTASSRLDRVFARPEPLQMTGDRQASCPLIIARGVRVGGPLGPSGRPTGARTIPPGSEGRLICGDVGVGELVSELRSNAFVARIPAGSNVIVILEARLRRGSTLFPAVAPYRRALAQIEKARERIARPRRRVAR